MQADFAGGLGTRLSEETHLKLSQWLNRDMPIIWHIMKIFSSYGVKDL